MEMNQPLLPIPPGSGTYYRRLYKFMGPFGLAGPREKVEATFASFQ